MTPDKLREKGNRWRELGQYDLANIYNQHAAALEEIERLNAAWKAQQFHLEAEERESAHWQERAEKAERRAERLKAHAEAMAGAWEKLDFDDGDSEDAMEEAVFAYRADKGE